MKPHKIDLKSDYPCPCGRKGTILPITLTDAFGCNRCQHIFTVDEEQNRLTQLSTAYSSSKAWYWTGHEWRLFPQKLRHRLSHRIPYLLLTLFLICSFLVYFAWIPTDVLLGIAIGGLVWLIYMIFSRR